MEISEEQRLIVDEVQTGNNIIIDAVSGSGKTTTIIFIAEKYPEKQILQLTYNRMLRDEVKEKTARLPNVDVQTYHGLATKYYRPTHDDIKLREIYTKPLYLQRNCNYHLVIVDEVQDMNDIYYQFLKYFLRNLNNPQLIFMGDNHQTVYRFKGSDCRYLILADKIWPGNHKRQFTKLNLTTSYRLSAPVCNFVNNVMLGEQRIRSFAGHSSNKKVKYLKIDQADPKSIGGVIIKLIREQNYKPDDIFILAASVTKNLIGLKPLANFLTANNINIYIPTNDDAGNFVTNDIIRNKVAFLTMHSSKGRERKIVFIYGFDNSYFQYYAGNIDPSICPDILYVAATRCKEQLFLIDHSAQTKLPFLKATYNDIAKLDYVQAIGLNGRQDAEQIEFEGKYSETSVTDLIKFITMENPAQINDLFVQLEPSSGTSAVSQIPNKVEHQSLNIVEEISIINAQVIIAKFQLRVSETTEIEKYLAKYHDRFFPELAEHFRTAKQLIGLEKLVKLACIFISFTTGVYYRLRQIEDFSWLDAEIVESLIDNIAEHVGNGATYEYDMKLMLPEFVIKARIDCIDGDTLWEFKCTSELTLEHKMQLIMYYWIYKQLDHKFYTEVTKFKLFNILTGEILELIPDVDKIDAIVQLIIDIKYKKIYNSTNEEFIHQCLQKPQGINP